MSDSPPSSPGRSEHDQMIDEVIFKRDLDEVHLLLDFVSGQTDKSLNSLTIADDSDPTGKTRLSTRAIVERITQIRYPPPGGTNAQNAADAAFLLVVKDQLNGMADPARGLTVAYTAMFVGSARRSRFPWAWLRGLMGAPGSARPDNDNRTMTLAQEVYPGLMSHAHLFRSSFAILVVVVLPIWLALTALAYWDTAFGRSIMQRFDHMERQRQALIQVSPELAHHEACEGTPRAEINLICAKMTQLQAQKRSARIDLDHFRRCDNASCNRWLHVMRWGFVLGGTWDGKDPEEHMVATVLSVYSNYILPMMFGLLGTMIAAIRKIQDQVGRSELHPRDFLLTALLVPMGAVAAVAVGLFYSPTGSGLGGSTSLSGDLTLAAGGVGFLAGYGSPAFFAMLDNLLRRAFRLDKPAPKDKPATPA